jgi:phage/plasmid-like protein (TIGR03299 family)
MAHLLDESNNQYNFAHVNEAAWHGLGQPLEAGQPIEVWAKAAGLSHEVRRAVVQYESVEQDVDHEGNVIAVPTNHLYADREVLYRSDTNAPLGVVGKNYNIVQPAHVLDFFAKLAENNHFTLETAGSLSGGKRVWALAKVSDGAPVIGQDVVKPYVLLATSYDGTLATTARLTSVRVVCSNTLGFATAEGGDTIKVPHNKEFSIEDTRLDLGIAFNSFDKFLIEARQLAKRQVNENFAIEFLKQLLPATVSVKTVAGIKTVTPVPVEETKAFTAILDLFKGEALGADLPEASGSAWALLNATTQYVDHVNGRNADTRLSSAWFGQGNALKSRARDQLLAVVA